MNRNSPNLVYVGKKIAAVLVAAGVLLCSVAFGQTIPNPSFETDNFTIYPGLVSDNGAITGWTVDNSSRAGLNPAGGASLYADNGTVPDGTKVAFMQSGVALSTTMSGLTAGQRYIVTFRANSQTPALPDEFPNVHVTAAGQDIWALALTNVGGANPYFRLAFEFNATAATETLSVANDSVYETAALLDDFKIAASTGRWTVDAWNNDSDSGVDASYIYTHAYNFGSAASPVINAIQFTGVAGPNPAVAGQFSTTNFGNVYTAPDDNNITGNSSVLADQFVYQGGDMSNAFQTIVITGLTSGKQYVATLYTAGWDDPSLTIRWVTLNAGNDYLTVNQDMFGNNNGVRFSYHYTADATGTVTLRIAPLRPLNVSMHIYGFSNREAAATNQKPEIALQPQSATVSAGVEVTFKVAATGFPAPTYRWRFNGADIAGANTDTYTVTASPASAGNYDVVVANLLGSATSTVAKLTVGMALVNPSFEADLFSTWPGYVNDNGPITGWNSVNGSGLNPVSDGRSPFADNGSIPQGTHAAFMQSDTALSQTVTGFTVGAEYYVHYYENGRSGPAGAMEVRIGTNTVVPAHLVPAVGGSNPYHEVLSQVFTATATDLELSFNKSNPQGGDSTVLIDNVTILRIPAGTAPFIGRNPQPFIASVGESATFSVQALGTSPLSYQWLKNGALISGAVSPSLTLTTIQKPDEADYSAIISNSSGSVTSTVAHLTVFETIPDLFNTGVNDLRAAAADGLADLHYTLIENADTNSTYAIIEDSTVFPIVDGTWLPTTAISKWIGPQFNTVASAVGTYVYRTTINLTDRDPSTVVIIGRWATDNAGTDIRVNGISTGNPRNDSFAAYTPFTIYGTNFVAGTNTLDFVVENLAAPGYTGLRVEIIRSNVRIPPGVPPEILTQPVGQTVAEGESVTFTSDARGTSPLSYQWLKNGAPIAGQTTTSLSLANVTTADSGTYALFVSNPVGTATSMGAALVVAYRPIPGIFGTGVSTNGQLLAAGEVDPHFILGASADPGYPGPDAFVVNDGFPIGTWLNNGPNSKWIAPWANQNDSGGSGGGNAGGDYTYQTSINLTGYDISKVRLTGAWAVDNAGTDILVNGVSTGLTSAGFGGLTPFVITNNLVAGTNTLDFIISNATSTTGAPNPTGLRVDLRALVAIDQPPTMQITRSGNNVSISWPDSPGVKLQSAPAIGGPWADVPNQTNPYITAATGTQFFRLTK